MMHREQKSDIITEKSNILTKKTFCEKLDEKGKNFFNELFKFSHEKGLFISWGTTGFSLNVPFDNENVSLLQGYSNFRGKGQTHEINHLQNI